MAEPPAQPTSSGYPLDALPVAAAWVDAGGTVRETNGPWRQRIGETEGRLADWIHPEDREAVAATLGDPTEAGLRPAVTCRLATAGGWRSHRLAVRADGGIGGLGLGAGWLLCVDDVGGGGLPVRFAQGVAEELSGELDASRLLRRAAERLVAELPVAGAAVPILDRDGHGAVVVAAAGSAGSLAGRHVAVEGAVCQRLAAGEGVALVPAEVVAADPLFADLAPAAAVVAPIQYRGRTLGGVCALAAGEASAELMECVGLLARFLTGALQGARNFDRLRAASDHHQRLLSVLPDPLWLVDAEGRVVECNRPAAELLGRPCDGLPVDDLFRGEAGATVARAVAAARGGERTDLRLPLGSGEVPCLVTVLPMPGEAANEAGVVVVARDISDWIASEREREQMRATTQEAARLASVGELATGMAHEINNPLMGIINYADLAREEVEPGSHIHEWMEVIIQEGERIAELLRHLRTLGRADTVAPEATDVAAVVEAACALVRHSLGREQIDLALDLPEGLPPVRAVGHQLQQALVALFSNARWAVAEARRQGRDGRGWIRIAARPVAGPEGGAVLVTMEDSGVGIAEADLARIFDPFFTRRSGRSGLGLGLSQVRRDVGSWGGRAYAEQGEAGGARLCLRIPVWREAV